MTVFSPLSLLPRRRITKHWLRLLLISLWAVVGIAASINLPAFTTPAAAQSSIIRINSGGPGYTGPDGRVWSADTGFSGGGTYASGATIAGTSDATLYQTERFGNFSYNLSVPNGTYQVNLKFAEIWFTTAGQRVFNVTIEGQTVLSNFDILQQVTFNTALDKSFTVNVTDGQLNIAFASVISNPKVSAIEVVPASGATRINAGGGTYTGLDGRVWSADTGFSGGGTYASGATIAGTSDATLYQTERFGNFSYNLSVPNGTYQVNLKFAEIWFTTAGQRVFNVTIEGQTVLSNFDILQQVTFNTALDKSFTVNVTDGQLNIAFASVISNPKVSAIEVVPAGGGAPAPTPVPAPATTAAYWGAYLNGTPWDTTIQDRFETMVGKKASIMPLTVYWQQNGQYYYFMGNSQQYFPTTTMEAIRQRGSIPMLVWGAADGASTQGVNQPNFRSSVVAGGTHDAYIRAFAQQAKAWGKPFFLKLNWEMNGYWNWPWMEGKINGTTIPNGNQPGDFARSWRHIHDVFDQQGVTNVTWVWCPNVADGWDAPFSQVYPGDAYVDWTCLHGYNWGNRYNPPGWQTFTQVFNSSFNANSYQQVVGLAPAKPMMLGEWASTELGDGGTAKANWITDALSTQIPNNFPQVRAFVWYSVNDGEPWPIDSSTPSQTAFRNALSSSFYTANTFAALPGIKILAPTR